VPYLKDTTRQEMYRLHCEDPEQWSVVNLSQKFHTSMARTEAVLFLMERRQLLMKEEADKISAIAEESVCEALYKEFVEKQNEAAIINKTGDVKTAKADRAKIIHTIAADNSMNPQNVDTIVTYMEQHGLRLQNLADNEMHMEALVGRLKEMGVPNADVFQETPTISPLKRNLDDDYFPELFGDEEFETKRKELLDRIAAETQGRPQRDLDHYLSTATKYDGSSIGGDGKPTAKSVPKRVVVPTASGATSEELEEEAGGAEKSGRWKFAFRDLSKKNNLGGIDHGQQKNRRTVICTRSGTLRYATPLEEAKRSWTRNPTHMDLINHKKQIAKFVDFDGDDHLTKGLALEKLNRRKKMILAKSGK
jgi:hypothetical protein